MGSRVTLESLFFLVVTVAHLYPIFSVDFFHTHDGAAHLYNAELIKAFLTNKAVVLSNYYEFNKNLDPNFISHLILIIVRFFFSGAHTEKIYLTICVVLLAYSFRHLVLALNKNSCYGTYFIFPFIYNFLFYMGFFNFEISIAILFFTLAFWYKHYKNISSFELKPLAILFIFSFLLFFSHIFSYSLFCLTTFFILSFKLCLDLIKSDSKTTLILLYIKQVITSYFVFIPTLCLYIYYMLHKGKGEMYDWWSAQRLIEYNRDIRSIASSNEGIIICQKLFAFITIVLLIILLKKVIDFFFLKKKVISIHESWAIIIFITLLLEFIMPNGIGTGGFIKDRMALYVFLFVGIYIAISNSYKIIQLLSVVIFIYTSFSLLKLYQPYLQSKSKRASEIYSVSNYIPTNSTVLPLNYNKDWFETHISNYLGIDKRMIIFENYEAGVGYFPLIWTPLAESASRFLRPYQTDNNGIICIDYNSFLTQNIYKLDYIFVWDEQYAKKNECNTAIEHIIRNDFELWAQTSSKTGKLYKHK